MVEKVTIEKETEQPQGKEAELLAEQSQEAKEEAKEHSQEAKEHNQEAEANSQEAEETLEEVKKIAEATQSETLSNQSVLNGLKESINLLVQRIEQIATITKETSAGVEDLAKTLETTIQAMHEVIGTVDQAGQDVILATESMRKMIVEIKEIKNS